MKTATGNGLMGWRSLCRLLVLYTLMGVAISYLVDPIVALFSLSACLLLNGQKRWNWFSIMPILFGAALYLALVRKVSWLTLQPFWSIEVLAVGVVAWLLVLGMALATIELSKRSGFPLIAMCLFLFLVLGLRESMLVEYPVRFLLEAIVYGYLLLFFGLLYLAVGFEKLSFKGFFQYIPFWSTFFVFAPLFTSGRDLQLAKKEGEELIQLRSSAMRILFFLLIFVIFRFALFRFGMGETVSVWDASYFRGEGGGFQALVRMSHQMSRPFDSIFLATSGFLYHTSRTILHYSLLVCLCRAMGFHAFRVPYRYFESNSFGEAFRRLNYYYSLLATEVFYKQCFRFWRGRVGERLLRPVLVVASITLLGVIFRVVQVGAHGGPQFSSPFAGIWPIASYHLIVASFIAVSVVGSQRRDSSPVRGVFYLLIMCLLYMALTIRIQ